MYKITFTLQLNFVCFKNGHSLKLCEKFYYSIGPTRSHIRLIRYNSMYSFIVLPLMSLTILLYY